MKNKKVLLIWISLIFILVSVSIYIQLNKTKAGTIFRQEQELISLRKNKIETLENLNIGTSEHIQGDLEKSQIVVIEYSDTECPFCKKFHYKFKKEILSAYPEKVAWIYRHFPLPIYPKSKKEAEALECATEQKGNGMFWTYLEKLFESIPGDEGLDPVELPKISQKLNLDIPSFNTCLQEGRYTEKVNSYKQGGIDFGVRSTPTVIIWNKATDERRLMSGANVRFLEVKTIIEEALNGRK